MRTRRVVLLAALAAMLAFTGQGTGAGRATSASWPPATLGAHTELDGLDSALTQVARGGSLGVARTQGLVVAGTGVRVVVEPSAGVAAAEGAVAAAGGRVEESAGGLV